MPYRFKDLIVTVIPQDYLDRVANTTSGGSGGCGGCSDAGSASVGSCTHECGGGDFCLGTEVRCGDSGEVLELRPYRFIDPPFQMELRQLLVYALARSGVKTPAAPALTVLEEQMQSRSLQEVQAVEARLAAALQEVRQQKDRLQRPSLWTRVLRVVGLRR